jgi:hypothetical protein
MDSITLGNRDSDGFSDVYIDGEKTNVRMLTFTKEQVDRLQEIQKEIQEKWDKEEKRDQKIKELLMPWHLKMHNRIQNKLLIVLKKFLNFIIS